MEDLFTMILLNFWDIFVIIILMVDVRYRFLAPLLAILHAIGIYHPLQLIICGIYVLDKRRPESFTTAIKPKKRIDPDYMDNADI